MIELKLNPMQVEDLIRLVAAQCKRVKSHGDGPYWEALQAQLREHLSEYRLKEIGRDMLRRSSTP